MSTDVCWSSFALSSVTCFSQHLAQDSRQLAHFCDQALARNNSCVCFAACFFLVLSSRKLQLLKRQQPTAGRGAIPGGSGAQLEKLLLQKPVSGPERVLRPPRHMDYM